MNLKELKTAYLNLKDGTILKGNLFGAKMESAGEVVFNTSMVGYPEALTDPSYRGQILVLTYPLIGNYGVPEESRDKYGIQNNFESAQIQIKGLIVSEYSSNYNHWHAQKSLSDWLKKYHIPGITGIDTRALTQKLRTFGCMLGKISINHQPKKLKSFFDPNLTNLVAEVSIKKPLNLGTGKKHIVIMDYGLKNNILRSFLNRGVSLTIIPWNYDPFEAKISMDGFFMTNGPGDPMMIKETCAIVQKALNQKIPTWGICMGNQILALAIGGSTYKMKFGHRSQNQPCIDIETNHCYITSQNHGYAVNEKSIPKEWKVWFKNVNDQTVEGIKHKTLPFRSVQFHPEATPGPLDTGYLFDEFVSML